MPPSKKEIKFTGRRKTNSPDISASEDQIYFLLATTNTITARNHTEFYTFKKRMLKHSSSATRKHFASHSTLYRGVWISGIEKF
jgi:hypothetical protein